MLFYYMTKGWNLSNPNPLLISIMIKGQSDVCFLMFAFSSFNSHSCHQGGYAARRTLPTVTNISMSMVRATSLPGQMRPALRSPTE